MMHAAWLSLAIDLGLLCSLVFFGLRMVRSSGPRVNLGRMVELEGSLRALLREAETGSRALTEQLLKRQKELERLLVEIESTSGRLSRQITEAEEQKGRLEVIAARASATMRAQTTGNASIRMPAVETIRTSEPETSTRTLQPYTEEFSHVEVEPPSFQSVLPNARPARREAVRVEEKPEVKPLSTQVERVIEEEPRETPRRKHRPSAVERALRAGAISTATIDAGVARESARELQRNKALSKPSTVTELEEPRSAVLSSEEAATASQIDPRLGVLSGSSASNAPIRRQVQVL